MSEHSPYPMCPLLHMVASSSPLGRLALTDEPEMFEAVLSRLASLYPADKTSIVLFGAGKFTRRLLQSSARLSNCPRITAILDDNAKTNQKIDGVPVRRPSINSIDKASAVLLATDSIENILEARCTEVVGNIVPIYRFSHLLSEIDPSIMALSYAERVHNVDTTAASPPDTVNCIIVCHGYADYLSWTLKHNLPHFDNMIVVTGSTDRDTQELVRAVGATLLVSDAYKLNGAAFNKGLMINEGLKALGSKSDWTLVTDADILLADGFRDRIDQTLLNPNFLYYAVRINAPDDATEEWLDGFLRGEPDIDRIHFIRPGANRMPWGYFQLFNPTAAALNRSIPNIYPADFKTAGDVDYAFMEKWSPEQRVLLNEAVIHIPHGGEGLNWAGRISPKIHICDKTANSC